MSDIWFSADGHLGHNNIIKYCNRPYNDVHHMNTSLIQNWNDRIKYEDTIYYLGDFSFKSDKFVYRLNGNIILIRGNHDKKRYNDLFFEVTKTMPLQIGQFNCFLRHKPISPKEEADLYGQYDYFICGHVHELWKIKGKNINVGVDQWEMSPVHIDELLSKIENPEGEDSLNLI